MIEKMLKKLAEYQERHVYSVLLLFIVVTAFFGTGAPMVSTEVSFEKEVPQEIEVIQTMFMIGDEFGGTIQMSVMIIAEDVRTPEIVRLSETLADQLEAHEYIDSAQSIADSVRASYGHPTSSTENIRTALEGSQLVNQDYSIALVNARLSMGAEDKEKRNDIIEYTLNVLEEQPLPENTELRLAGLPYQEYSLINMVGSEMGKITLIAFIGILLIAIIMFRNILHGVTTIIPVGMAMFWTVGFAGYAGIAISTPLIGVLSMILGLGVDYSIHIIHRYREQRKEGNRVLDAITHSVTRIGKGIMITSFTTMGGFLALLAASMPMLHKMGILMATGIFFAMIVAIGLVPAILVLEERMTGMLMSNNLKGESK